MCKLKDIFFMFCIIEMGAWYQHWLCHINYICETLDPNDPNQIFNHYVFDN